MSNGVTREQGLEVISAAAWARIVDFLQNPNAEHNTDISKLPINFYDLHHNSMYPKELSQVPPLSEIPGVKTVYVDPFDILKRTDVKIFRRCSFKKTYFFDKETGIEEKDPFQTASKIIEGYFGQLEKEDLEKYFGKSLSVTKDIYPNGQTNELRDIYRLVLLTDIASILIDGAKKIDGLYLINGKEIKVSIPPLTDRFGSRHEIIIELNNDKIKNMACYGKFIGEYKAQNYDFFGKRAEKLEDMMKSHQPVTSKSSEFYANTFQPGVSF
jgi:hypothetical protein